jgi:hypothetical protein
MHKILHQHSTTHLIFAYLAVVAQQRVYMLQYISLVLLNFIQIIINLLRCWVDGPSTWIRLFLGLVCSCSSVQHITVITKCGISGLARAYPLAEVLSIAYSNYSRVRAHNGPIVHGNRLTFCCRLSRFEVRNAYLANDWHLWRSKA